MEWRQREPHYDRGFPFIQSSTNAVLCIAGIGRANGSDLISPEGSVRRNSERDQALPMILNMPVPHVGHVPFIALRPLAMTTSFGSFMSRFALHFTQYASTAMVVGFGSTVMWTG